MKISLSLCVFILVVVCFQMPAFSQASPEEVVRKLYEATRTKHINAMDQDRLKQFFTPELIKNLPKSYQAWPVIFPKGTVDFHFEMSSVSNEHDALAHVSYNFHNAEWLFEYHFRTVDDGTWRISNIIGAPGTHEEYPLSRATRSRGPY